jgi:hypothetical protein
MAEPPTLPQLLNGYRTAQAIHVAAVLGIADVLAGGPRTADELADACGAHAESLERLLRALASIGVLEEQDDRRFALAELGQGLRSDVPGSLAGWAAFIGRPAFWQSWGARSCTASARARTRSVTCTARACGSTGPNARRNRRSSTPRWPR